ncbi:helix-turn-helix transcriptional regulator [Cellulomonas sp. NPDC057328]|uniref:helix-turn-helix transcriptional regulator n=1 Tax=Cellulomonas sp. NPDC057328 TaxID=3346101 RepID=UPI0036253FD7
MREDVLGRDEELRRLGLLVGRARDGRGGALLLVGDAGIGKTTLLHAAGAHAGGLQLVRVDGYEAEQTIPFAAVQRCLRQLHEHLPALPDRHRHALEVASGEAAGAPPDRFLVGLGVLSLLGVAGQRRPVVCVVDDAHLLDPESLDVLAFVARRLEAERAVLLLAAREDDELAARTAGIDTLRLGGLPTDAAVRLLAGSLPGLDPAVAVQVAAATGGNPLALVDLAGELTVRRLSETTFGDEPLPIGRHLEQFYLRQVRALDADAQRWLLVAAAESTGDADLIDAAARELGLADDAADAAETAGLVERGRAVAFRHPLVRSAAYNAAHGKERRQVHRALSTIAEKTDLPERAAWHAAKATVGTDEDVAQRLELVADQAAARGGFASRARVLAEASALTPPGRRRYARLVRAAEAALVAGRGQLAKDLVDEIDDEVLDPVSRGRLMVVDADYALFVAAPALTHAAADMLAAAELFHDEDPELEQTALVRAWERALPAERSATGLDWDDVGRRLTAGAGVRDGDAAVVLRALGALVRLPYAEAVPLVRAALDAFERMDDASFLRLGASSVGLATAVWDVDARHRLMTRCADVARDAGALQALDCALWALALVEAADGSPRRAVQYMEQVRELRRAIGYEAEHVVNLSVLVWSGVAREQVHAIAGATLATGFGGVHSAALAGLAVVDLADGRYAQAYDLLAPFVADPFFHVTPTLWPDHVEACVRSGRLDEGERVLRLLEERAAACASPWALGLAARSRALVDAARAADDASASARVEEAFGTAVALLDGLRTPVDLGRAHLLHGEWLRRRRRRADARTHLRRAAEILDHAGAEPFAARARRELEAAGDTVAVAAAPGRPAGLTPQELTVAELAAAGRTNAEIGATMFLSVNTVDYHLRKVFQKLGISSRRQLADRLGRA